MNFSDKLQNFKKYNRYNGQNFRGITIRRGRRYRFNDYFLKRSRKFPTVFNFPKINYIDVIEIDNTTYKWPNFVLPMTKLLNQDYKLADINGTEVIKGNMKYKYPINEIKTHTREEVNKSLLVQALLPADLGYLALAYDDLFNLPGETTVTYKFEQVIKVNDPLERKKLLATLVLEAKRDEKLIEEYKRWCKVVANELQALNYNKFILYRGKKIFLKNVCNNLAAQLEHVDINVNYDKKLSKSKIKFNGIFMDYFIIAVYLACISKSLLLLQHNQGDVYFPANYLYLLRFLNLIPTKLLFYSSRALDPPFETYVYLC